MAVPTLPINVVDFVCSANAVVVANAPTVRRPAAKVAKAKVAKGRTATNHVNDVNSVHAAKVKVAASMDSVVSAIVRVARVVTKMAKSSMAMVAMVLVRPAKVLAKVRVAKTVARNASSGAIFAVHHADHVAADHRALARVTTAMPREAKMAKKDHEELDVTIETAHQNRAAPIK